MIGHLVDAKPGVSVYDLLHPLRLLLCSLQRFKFWLLICQTLAFQNLWQIMSQSILDFRLMIYLHVRSGRAPNSTGAPKELKWHKSDSKVTPKASPQSDPKVTQIDSKVPPDPILESLLSHLGSLWGGALGVTFGPLLGHFDSVCVSVELGACSLLKPILRY